MDSDSPAYYDANGYCVFRRLVEHRLIDELLAEYRSSILSSSDRFLRQSTDLWERNDISPEGHCRQSFQDVHDFRGRYARFSECARAILCSLPVREALAAISGAAPHRLVQSMLFDLNTETGAHQDYWYLDSVPGGYLAAGWFALEDIAADAGRFYVLPGSHRAHIPIDAAESMSSGLFQRKVAAYVQERMAEIIAPALCKGDVLFWNSRTIHGSLPTRDATVSRKSLTAHYLAEEHSFGNIRGPIPARYAEHQGMSYRLNERQYSAREFARARAFRFLDAHPFVHRCLRGLQRLVRFRA